MADLRNQPLKNQLLKKIAEGTQSLQLFIMNLSKEDLSEAMVIITEHRAELEELDAKRKKLLDLIASLMPVITKSYRDVINGGSSTTTGGGSSTTTGSGSSTTGSVLIRSGGAPIRSGGAPIHSGERHDKDLLIVNAKYTSEKGLYDLSPSDQDFLIKTGRIGPKCGRDGLHPTALCAWVGINLLMICPSLKTCTKKVLEKFLLSVNGKFDKNNLVLKIYQTHCK